MNRIELNSEKISVHCLPSEITKLSDLEKLIQRRHMHMGCCFRKKFETFMIKGPKN